jgi:DNA-binding XRE family transcriptional regulator
MDKDTFKRKRDRLGLTQEEMGKRLGKNRITIIRYESGETPVPKAVEMALKLIETEERK